MPTRPDPRATLEGRLSDLLGRDARLASRLRHDGGVPDDWPDRASALAAEDVVSQLDIEARGEVAAIRAALARLESGTYGVCTRCGGAIGAARLHALPWTPTCVDCAG